MKTTTTKRKTIADAVELLKEESPNAPGNIAGVQLIPIEKVRAFKDHPFRLYEGERLDDMVQSIRDHGILNPVIVWKVYGGDEMLAGHNRMNAAQIVNIIPLGSHQFPASEPPGNGIFHLQSHHNILWQHTYLISL